MKVFIAFGYNDRDKWIKETIFPLIQSFGITPLSGEDLYGEILSEEVKKRIREADALLAFCTQRKQFEGGKFATHPWVLNELSAAITENKKIAIFMEDLVDVDQLGMAKDRQRTFFKLEEKEKLLIELIKALHEWKQKFSSLKIKLIPETVTEELKAFLADPKSPVFCEYCFYMDGKETEFFKTKVRNIKNTLYIEIDDIPKEKDITIQLRITVREKLWFSAFEELNEISISMLSAQISESKIFVQPLRDQSGFNYSTRDARE